MNLVPRLAIAYGISFLAGCYVRQVSWHLRPGLLRFIACIPVIVFNSLTPFAFDSKTEYLSKGMILVALVWASNFKVTSVYSPECSAECA